MSEIYYDLTQPNSGMNYRWIQPPQIAYLVTTIDGRGNVNSTPVTLGTCVSVDMEPSSCGNYFYTFALGCSDLPDVPARHGWSNLHEVPECVISYLGTALFREAEVACLPIPKGISEMAVAGLTEIPSRHVRPPGIRECGVNIEMRVVSSQRIGQYYELFVCQAVGASVDADLVRRDAESPLYAGVLAIDPLYEVNVFPDKQGVVRLHTIQLDPSSSRRMPDEFGPTRSWVGSFEGWVKDELARGRLAEKEAQLVLDLNASWQHNPDPVRNGEVRQQLTERLRELVRPS